MMSENKEKRMISDTGYEVRQSFHIGGKEILLAENQKVADGQFYLVCNYVDRGFIGEYSQAVTDDDYLGAVQEFTGRVGKEAAAVQAEFDARGLPGQLFTATDCYPHNYTEGIEGKVVAIKAAVFSPEYRRGDCQLVYAVRGNGAPANPRGNAVYCYHLNTGEHTRFERYEVLGVVKELPDWAQTCLARVKGEIDKPVEAKEFAGNYEIKERIEVGQKVFALGHCERAVNPYGTWQGHKNSKGDFDWGHYFDSYEEAKTDLHDRAAKEQERLDRPKRNGKGR
jgi:hypothetical protein